MKQVILICKVVVIVVLLSKIAGLAGIMGIVPSFRASWSVEEAVAEEGRFGLETSAEAGGIRLKEERELLKLLIARERELTRRETALAAEEERLRILKGEIISQIDTLGSMMESIRVIDDKQHEDLAKVYEATPPAQAGAMLERLDRRTAAAIIMRMRSRQAGEIWGHLDPDTAAAITREITTILTYEGGEPR